MEYIVEGTLSFGAKVEVFYKLEKENGRVEDIWWPATVKKLCLVQNQRGNSLSGTILFHPLHGFPSSASQVVFERDFEIRDKNGIVYSWRKPLQEAPSAKSSSSASVDDAAGDSDEDYNPDGDEAKKRRGKIRPASQSLSGEAGPVFKSQRKLYELERAIMDLRSEVKEQGRKLDAKEYVPGTMGRRVDVLPLEFMRLKIQAFLDKPVTSAPRLSPDELRTGASFHSQEHLRKFFDCTLIQFDSIMEYVQRVSGDRVTFNPSFEGVKKTPRSEVRITFDSFDAMTRLFVNGSSSEKTALIKTKVERSSGNVISARILGCVVQNVGDESKPFYISVGEGIEFQKPHSRQVLLREETSWNHVEGKFSSPMKAACFPYEDMLGMTRTIIGEEIMEKYLQRRSFRMVWRNESHPDLGKFLTATVDPALVLGTLELVIPFVLVRGRESCGEMMKLLEERTFH